MTILLKIGDMVHNEFLLKSIEITQKLKRNDYDVLSGVSSYLIIKLNLKIK